MVKIKMIKMKIKLKLKELTDSPMPQDLLHAPHAPQPVTWQFRGSGNTKFRDKSLSENIFSLFLTLFPLSLLGAQPPLLLVSLEQVVRGLLCVVGGQDLAVQSRLASRLQQQEMCRLYKFRPHICHRYHRLYPRRKIYHVEKFQISVKNLNNL